MPGIIDTDMQALIRGTDAMDEKKRQYFVQLKKNNQLLTTAVVADYLIKLLLDTDVETFVSKEWDIYESGEYAFPNE
jgi:hypothetical protein